MQRRQDSGVATQRVNNRNAAAATIYDYNRIASQLRTQDAEVQRMEDAVVVDNSNNNGNNTAGDRGGREGVAGGATSPTIPEESPAEQELLAHEAYQLPDVVDATGVAAVLSEREEEELSKKRQTKFLWIGAGVCCIVALAIIVPLVTIGNEQEPEIVLVTPSPTTTSAMINTATPTTAPTVELQTPELIATIEFLKQEEGIVFSNAQREEEVEWWNDKSSDAYKAAKWLSEEIQIDQEGNIIYNNNPNKLLQRYSLATFYYALSNDDGGSSTWIDCGIHSIACPGGEPWVSHTQDECDWGYVFCRGSDNSNVTELIFPSKGNGLSGTLPPQLSLLSHLQVVAVPNNRIRSGGDSGGGSSNTTATTNNKSTNGEGEETDNNLHSIDQAFYGLSSLELLNLYNNEITGTVPTNIWKTNPNLQKVMLSLNSLTGTLTGEEALGQATNCIELHFENNMLSGSVPSSLGLLHSNLRLLKLGNNRFSGSLPREFFALTQLTTLALTNNTNLRGDFHTDQMDGFVQLTNLQHLEAANTNLGGTIPDTIYQSLTNMQTWNVVNASFRGTLSEEIRLWNATLQTLWLQGQGFTGVLPTALDSLTTLEELRLEGNSFEGTISSTLCDRKGERFGELHILTVDCSVECTCCDDNYEEKCG